MKKKRPAAKIAHTVFGTFAKKLDLRAISFGNGGGSGGSGGGEAGEAS
jgi:hypothetical protein